MTPLRTLLACAVFLAALPMQSVRASESFVTINVRDANLSDIVALISREAGLNVVLDGSVPTTIVPSLTLVNVTTATALAAIEAAYSLRELTVGDPKRGGCLRLVSTSSANGGTSLDGAIETIVVPLGGANVQAYGALLQQTLRGVAVAAPQGGHALFVSGLREMVERARPIIAAILGVPETLDGLPDAVPFGVSHGLPSEVLGRLQSAGFVDPPTIVVPDDAHNRLLVRAPASQLAAFEKALATFDTPVPIVTFDCQVIDVQPSYALSGGFSWGGINSSGAVTVGQTFTQFTSRMLPVNVSINALVTNGSAKIVARPSVSMLNGRKGAILVGEQYPIATTNGTLQGGQTVQFVPIGAQLALTPIIGADGTITVDLTTTYSELNGLAASGYPIISQSTVQSMLAVRDGEAIIIAGLFQDINSASVSKVPLLGDIPVLGEIFKNRTKNEQRDEIVFALYPHLGVASAPPLQAPPGGSALPPSGGFTK